jgi:hypothetical protein
MSCSSSSRANGFDIASALVVVGRRHGIGRGTKVRVLGRDAENKTAMEETLSQTTRKKTMNRMHRDIGATSVRKHDTDHGVNYQQVV